MELPSRGLVLPVLVAALSVRVAFFLSWNGDPLAPDSHGYLAIAENIRSERGFSLDGKAPDLSRAPLYPALLAALKLPFADPVVPMRLLQSLLDAGTAVYVLWLGFAVAGPAVGLLGAFAYCAHPVFAGFSQWVLSETVFFHLWFLFLALAAESLRRRCGGWGAAAGVVLALAVLCRPVPQFFPAFLLPVFLLRGGEPRRRLLHWALLCAGFAAALLPWTLRNRARSGEWIPVATGGGVAFWIGSLDHYPERYELNAVAPGGDHKSIAADRAFAGEARRNWRANYRKLVFHMPHRFRKFWLSSHSSVFRIDESNSEMVADGRWGRFGVKLLLLLLQLEILAAGLWGAWRVRRRWREWLLLAMPVLYFTLHLTNDWGPARYHLPALPCLFLLAAWGCRARDEAEGSGDGRGVLVLCHEWPPVGGGGGRGAAAIAGELAKDRRVDVLTSAAPGLARREQSGRLDIFRSGLPLTINLETESRLKSYAAFAAFTCGAFARGWLLCLERRYTAIHSHFAIPAGAVGALLSKLTGIPQLCTLVEADIFDARTGCREPYSNPLIRGAIAWTLRNSGRLTAISEAVRRVAREAYGAPEIAVVHYGLPEPRFARRGRAELGAAEGEFVAVFVGRLVERKGLAHLLKGFAVAKLAKSRLWVIGEGPERSGLEAFVGRLGLGERVVFLGHLDDERFAYLAAADVFVFPSLHEGLGLALMEAMALGLPVIATASGGPLDLVADGENGFLVPPADAGAIAEKLTLLAGDAGLRRRMGEANRRKGAGFSLAAAAARYERLLDFA